MPAQARIVLVWGLLILLMAVVNTVMAQSVTPELQRAEVLSAIAAVTLLLVLCSGPVPIRAALRVRSSVVNRVL